MPLIADDESEFQPSIVRAADGRRLRIFRGTFGAHYLDRHCLANANEAAREYKSGEIDGVLIYAVPLPSATPDEFVAFLKKALGPTPPAWLIGLYQDWERWRGTSYSISGDHSSWANRAYGLLAGYMGSWTASGFYGNAGDLAALIPHRDPRAWVIDADYGPNLSFTKVRGQIGQQYTDGQTRWGLPVVNGRPLPHTVTGAGACDHNAFDPKRFPTAKALRAYMRPSVPAHAAPAPTTPAKAPAAAPKPPVASPPSPAALYAPWPGAGLFVTADGRLEVHHDGKVVAHFNPD